MPTRTLALLCLIGSFALAGMPDISAQELGVPQLINYQGQVADAEGQPPPTGDYTLSFSIYDEPFSAPCSTPTQTDCARRVWGPQVFDGKTDAVGHGLQVPVVRGYFNVILGPYDIHGMPILQGFTSSKRFLEITVAGDDPVLPRQQVLSTPFALASAGAVPVGGIIAYSGDPNALPDNWMICNGDDIDDTDSPLNGTSVPDLRGLFVRGTENPELVTDISGSDSNPHSHTVSANFDIYTSARVWSFYSDPYVVPETDEESGFWLYGGGEYDVKRHREALEVRMDNRESHKHAIDIQTDMRSSSTSISKIPRHMSLYYAIRIK